MSETCNFALNNLVNVQVASDFGGGGLRVPLPLQGRDPLAQEMFPWRSSLDKSVIILWLLCNPVDLPCWTVTFFFQGWHLRQHDSVAQYHRRQCSVMLQSSSQCRKVALLFWLISVLNELLRCFRFQASCQRRDLGHVSDVGRRSANRRALVQFDGWTEESKGTSVDGCWRICSRRKHSASHSQIR